jgi:hypothetical protein
LTKKNGEPVKAPRLILGWSLQLEAELEPVCQRAQLRVGRNTGDLATSIYSAASSFSTAVDAPVRIPEVDVVKYVVELELELGLRLFRDTKVLEQG